tara:strand:- start:942 stop:1388 length:447 start_codon:yes stop_codon:yes gene_type:complete
MKYNIYKITSHQTNDVYYGYTQKSLRRRLQLHKADYTLWCNDKRGFIYSFLVVCFDDAKIQLVEKTNNKLVEKYHIRMNDCCNYVNNKTINDYIRLIEDKRGKVPYIRWRFQFYNNRKIIIQKYSKNKEEVYKFALDWFKENNITIVE